MTENNWEKKYSANKNPVRIRLGIRPSDFLAINKKNSLLPNDEQLPIKTNKTKKKYNDDDDEYIEINRTQITVLIKFNELDIDFFYSIQIQSSNGYNAICRNFI